MFIQRYECDVCKRASNGDMATWFAIFYAGEHIQIERLVEYDPVDKHACGEEHALSLVAEMMRGLPR